MSAPHPTVNWFVIGFRKRDGIPSIFGRYIPLKISLTRKFQPPREVDKSASGEEISPSYSMAKIFHECQNNFVSLPPKTIVKKHLL